MMQLDNILGIVVLYNCRLEDSKTLSSLRNACHTLQEPLDVIVYDNGTFNQSNQVDRDVQNIKLTYIHNPQNPGIATAYNKALRIAIEQSKDWLLLMDQDTEFNQEFITALQSGSWKREDVVCAVPRIISTHDGNQISPSEMKKGGVVRPISAKQNQVFSNNVTALNSGCLVSVALMRQLGGFNLEYPLDILDHWLFRQIANGKKKVFFLDAQILHGLSVTSFEEDVSVARYKSILQSERLFLRTSPVDYIIYKCRLIFRLTKQLRYRNKQYWLQTLNYLLKW